MSEPEARAQSERSLGAFVVGGAATLCRLAGISPASICDIGACCAMTTVATGLTESLSTEGSSERVVTSAMRSSDSRASSDSR